MVWLGRFLIALCASAFFAGSETALVSSDRLRQRAAGEKGHRLARLAERLYLKPERTLSLLLLGNNLANILASMTALMITDAALESLGVSLPQFWADLISSLWVATVVLFFGEILAKTVGHAYAVRLTRLNAPLLSVLSLILFPLIWLLGSIGRLLNVLLTPSSERGGDRTTWDTVRLHLETGRALGLVEEQEEGAILRIGDLSRRNARELMVPLAELETVPADIPLSELRALLREKPLNHIFVRGRSDVELLGLLPVRRLLDHDGEAGLEELCLKLRRVPFYLGLMDLIDELQLSRSKFAMVTSLDGSCLGMVFLDDLMRHLVLTRGQAG